LTRQQVNAYLEKSAKHFRQVTGPGRSRLTGSPRRLGSRILDLTYAGASTVLTVQGVPMCRWMLGQGAHGSRKWTLISDLSP